jgi:hypothetical protein
MWYQRRQNKYNSKKTSTQFGKFDSKKEAAYCEDLELMKRAGEILDYERQVRYDLYGKNGGQICYMRVDFVVEYSDTTKEVHEVKSNITMTPEWNIKRKLFEDNYPETKYLVIN